MVRYVLDTDHISLFLGNHQPTGDRVLRELAGCVVTVISVQEVFNGWVGRLGRVTDEPSRIQAYTRLHQAATFFQQMPILNYEAIAAESYEQLVKAHPNLAKRRLENDMRIAAIALSLGATVVTRNRKDFELVPELVLEDWSV
jgi:tRNA(fMet)-specific endonuclease VapC